MTVTNVGLGPFGNGGRYAGGGELLLLVSCASRSVASRYAGWLLEVLGETWCAGEGGGEWWTGFGYVGMVGWGSIGWGWMVVAIAL